MKLGSDVKGGQVASDVPLTYGMVTVALGLLSCLNWQPQSNCHHPICQGHICAREGAGCWDSRTISFARATYS